MEASFVDLRKKSAEIIDALRRNERITVMYRGKPAAIMEPVGQLESGQGLSSQHRAFGLWADHSLDVDEEVRALRRRRYDDL